MNKFSYLILYIVHAHNVGISWLRLYASVRRCYSDRMRNSGRMPDSNRKTWHQSYARLWSYVQLRSYAQLWSEDATPVVCLTLAGRPNSGHMRDSDHMRNFSHMPDSDRKTGLPSYARLWLEDMTPVVYPDSGHTSSIRSTSRLRSRITAPVEERAACLTYSSGKDYA
jgi:hypothetical protein